MQLVVAILLYKLCLCILSYIVRKSNNTRVPHPPKNSMMCSQVCSKNLTEYKNRTHSKVCWDPHVTLLSYIKQGYISEHKRL